MSIQTHWTSAPENLKSSLQPGSVHVWRAPLDHSPERAYRFRQFLSADERNRADRCRRPHPQYQFVVTRSLLRILLSRYLKIQPTKISFLIQPHGKPMLASPSFLPVQFNVAHTQGMALIAVTLQHSVGIDVEWIDRNIQDTDIAERYFSARESAYLASLAPPERTHQFFVYWTCKEAFLKMKGKGISEGLAQTELCIEPHQPEVRLACFDRQEQKEEYSLYQIQVGAKHVGALALDHPSAQISYWNWEDNNLD